MRIKVGLALVAACALLLSACAFSQAETPRQKAYALGVEFSALQEGAIAYVENGKPSPTVAAAIGQANGIAAGLVKATIVQAMKTEAAQDLTEEEAAPADTGAIGISAGITSADNATAQASAFDRLYGLATAALGRLSSLIGGA